MRLLDLDQNWACGKGSVQSITGKIFWQYARAGGAWWGLEWTPSVWVGIMDAFPIPALHNIGQAFRTEYLSHSWYILRIWR